MPQDRNLLAGSQLDGIPRPGRQPEERLIRLDELLGQLDEVSAPSNSRQVENQLLAVRLGIASSLFTSLRLKHGPTADHSLRVALGCSSWADCLGMTGAERDELEVSALLHEIGKLGVADAILRKPSALSPDQANEVTKARLFGIQILAPCVPEAILNAISHVGAWFDGSRSEYPLRGTEIPASARMVDIVNVFDAMISDSVYRKAVSQERAVAELFRAAGTQFDPALVKQFADAHAREQLHFIPTPAHGWLTALTAEHSNALWKLRVPESSLWIVEDDRVFFHEELAEGIPDAVLFIDIEGNVTRWNRGAEKLTGISATALV
ncbi:MAG TPA: HD domain-containing phosphohydrolase, partial [Pirellulaceae bacterium]